MGDIIIFPSNWMFYHEVQKLWVKDILELYGYFILVQVKKCQMQNQRSGND